MCNNNVNNETGGCRCLAEILEVIVILQKNADRDDNCIETCDRGFLGNISKSFNYNTRPVQLFCGCNGLPWSMPVSNGTSENGTSNVFRCEKVDGCCATFRVLEPNTEPDACGSRPYVATNSFFTMNLSCCCCLKCLPDTHVECL